MRRWAWLLGLLLWPGSALATPARELRVTIKDPDRQFGVQQRARWRSLLKQSLVSQGYHFEPRRSAAERAKAKAWPVRDDITLTLSRKLRGYQISAELERDLESKTVARRLRPVLFFNEIPAALLSVSLDLLKPLGRLQRQTGREASLRLRSRDMKGLKPGVVFRLLRRRKGQRKGAALRLTLFQATSLDAKRGVVTGTLLSGGAPRSDGRYEEFATPLELDRRQSLELLLVDRQQQRPLRGYQLYEERDGKTVFRGVTDGRGRLSIPFERAEVKRLQIRFNQLILARFPAVPAPYWRGQPLRLRLKRRPDLSEYHRQLTRISHELEELLLLREVAMEDVSRAIADRQFSRASAVLKTFMKDCRRLTELKQRLHRVRTQSRSNGEDLGAAIERVEKQLKRDSQRLDVSLVEAQLEAMKDRVSARNRAEQLLIEANAAVAQNNIPDAIARLRKAVLADPAWPLPKKTLKELEAKWKVKSPEHRKARELILDVNNWDWKDLRGRFDELNKAVAELKKQKDRLALRGAIRTLTRAHGELNEQAKRLLRLRQLARAKEQTEVALKIGPLIDEIAAFLQSSEK